MNVRPVLLAYICILLGACERSKASEPAPAVAPRPTESVVASDAAAEGSAAQVDAEVRAAMTEFVAYAESIVVIMRDHGKDCDVAAKHLAEREPVFKELAPRMMAIKDKLQALSPEERDQIMRESDQMMEAFQKRDPDFEMTEQRGKECEKSSAAFAAITPRVMFTKKK